MLTNTKLVRSQAVLAIGTGFFFLFGVEADYPIGVFKISANQSRNLCVDDCGATEPLSCQVLCRLNLRICNASSESQQFTYDQFTGLIQSPNKNQLCVAACLNESVIRMARCNRSDPTQTFFFNASSLQIVNVASLRCWDSAAQSQSLHLSNCSPYADSQHFQTVSTCGPGNIIDTLFQGNHLLAGQGLTSQDGNWTLTYFADGTICVHRTQSSTTVWCLTDAKGYRVVGPRGSIRLQDNGNLVVYNSSADIIFSVADLINTQRQSNPVNISGPFRLIMQDDGTLVLYGEVNEIEFKVWSSNTSTFSYVKSTRVCTPCPPGTYSTVPGGFNPCISCSAGKYSESVGASASIACQNCSAGSYSVQSAALCDNCIPGRYSTQVGAKNWSSCLPCSVGAYSSGWGSSACRMCSEGTFSSMLGATACEKCAAGLYSPLGNSSSCGTCDIGKYSTVLGAVSQQNCSDCARGTYGNKIGASSSSTCSPCTAGTYNRFLAASACANCTGGNYSDTNGSTACQICLPGTYSEQAASSCQICAAATYSSASGAMKIDACLPCQSGTFSSISGASSMSVCTNCSAGSYSSSSGVSGCQICAAGSYSSAIGASFPSTCLNCTAGTYSTAIGATSSGVCVKCGAGKYSTTLGSPTVDLCLVCPAGTFSTSSASSSAQACINCRAGSYASAPSSTFCQNCSIGTYSTAAGSQSSGACLNCSAGTFSITSGANSSSYCKTCLSGSFSSTVPASSSSFCLACSAGKYSTAVGAAEASSCKNCPAGSYSAAARSSCCQNCTIGYYSTAFGLNSSSLCQACARGSYSTTLGASSSTSCRNCSAGSYSSGISSSTSSACRACPAGTFSIVVGASSSLSCVNCSVGTYSIGLAAATSCALCTAGTFAAYQGSSRCQLCVPGNYAWSNGSSVCFNCPNNSWSIGGARSCSANIGYYDLGFNLMAYYTFNPNAFLADSSGNLPDLQVVSKSPTVSPGSKLDWPNQNVALFGQPNGVTDNGTFGQFLIIPPITIPQQFSICVWFNSSTCPASGRGACDRSFERIFDLGQGKAMGNIILGRNGTSTAMYFNLYGQSGSILPSNNLPNQFLSSVWEHVCLCVDGSHYNASIYVNSARRATMKLTSNRTLLLLNSSYIGRSNWQPSQGASGDKLFMGAIDELRIYNKVLSSAEVEAVYKYRGDGTTPMIFVACPGVCNSGQTLQCSNLGIPICCGAGTSLSSSQGNCTPCSPGSYSTSGLCQNCNAGTYSTAVGAQSFISCKNCSVGTYVAAARASSPNDCVSCAVGKYSITSGASSSAACLNCIAGTFASSTSQSDCENCSAGTYSAVPGASSSSTCLACGAGTYSVKLGASSSSTCQSICPPGSISFLIGATGCLSCKEGTFSSATGLSVCTLCSPGNFSTSGSSKCESCKSGSYARNQGSSTCLMCESGSYADTAERTVCTTCRAGSYSTATGAKSSATCLRCTGGKYASVEGSSFCEACPAGTYFSQRCFWCPGSIAMSWTAAKDYCVNHGGQLASVQTSGENEFLLSLLTSKGIEVAWIGLHYAVIGDIAGLSAAQNMSNSTSESWVWDDGASVEFDNWNTKYPQPSFENLSCAYINSSSALGDFGVGTWFNDHCSKSLGFVCSNDTCQEDSDWGHVPIPCSPCAPGTYANATAVSACNSCTAGEYSSTIGASACQLCVAGTYSSGEGMFSTSTLCVNVMSTTCPSSLYSTGCKLVCGTGIISRQNYANQESMIWIIAPDGAASVTLDITLVRTEQDYDVVTVFGCSDSSCIQPTSLASFSGNKLFSSLTWHGPMMITWTSDISLQYAGWSANWTSATNGLCTACVPGTFSTTSGASDNSTCFGCAPGLYTAVFGASYCTSCSSGAYSSIEASTTCLKCVPGQFSTETPYCFLARQDRSNFSVAQQQCLSLGGNLASITSPALLQYVVVVLATIQQFWIEPDIANPFLNSLAPNILWNAVNCPKIVDGVLSNVSCSEPAQYLCSIPCDINAMSSTSFRAGATVCSTCSQGKYSSIVSSSQCLLCPAGSFSSAFNAMSNTSCLLCTAGTFSTTIGAVSALSCTNCSAGNYSGVYGVTSCRQCRAGKYSNFVGATADSTCKSCPAGTYNGGLGASACSNCRSGTYCNATEVITSALCSSCQTGKFSSVTGASSSASCTSCSAGKYANVSGMTSCISCSKGTFSTTSGLSACFLCAAGSFSSSFGLNSSCQSCPAGFYANASGSYLCLACRSGFYSKLGAASCTICQPGTFADSDGSSMCTQCAIGSYGTAQGANSSSATCQLCKPGSFSNETGSTRCLLCAKGTYTISIGASNCTRCSAGTFSGSLGATNCSRCVAGTYSEIFGASQCTVCGQGTYLSSLGATNCFPCESGFYSSALGGTACNACFVGTFSTVSGSNDSKNCFNCLSGTYGDRAGLSSCIACGYGTFSSVSAAATNLTCLVCQAGTYGSYSGMSACAFCEPGKFSSTLAASSSAVCVPCLQGKYSNISGANASARCANCEQGKYSNMTGQIACVYCNPGTYSSVEGAEICILCDSGKYTGLLGSSACSSCEVGTFSPQIGSVSNQTCLACSEGSFSSSPATSECTACQAGTYSATIRASKCIQCRIGTFSTERNAINCTLCGVGTYTSQDGSTFCSKCSRGTYSQALGNTACMNCSAGTYSSASGFTLCQVCQPGAYSALNGSYFCPFCQAGGYSTAVGGTRCNLCIAGTISMSNATFCTQCSTGAFSTASGGVNCTQCSPGLYSATMGATRCLQCIAGTYSNQFGVQNCSLCRAGYFTSALAGTSCGPCRPGTYSTTPGTTACTACQAGMYSAATAANISSTCSLCQQGSYSDIPGVSVCTLCGIGKYSTFTGGNASSSCIPCSMGKFSAALGANDCPTCDKGRYSSLLGQTVCLDCLTGTYASQTNLMLCVSCSAGTFSTQTAQSVCISCQAGTYSTTAGSSDANLCLMCTPGKYSSAAAADANETCLECPAGTFSTIDGLGSRCDGKCEAGTYSTTLGATSTDTCVDCSAGTYSSQPATTTCSICLAGTYSPRTRANATTDCLACDAGTFSASESASSSEVCRSCHAGTYSLAGAQTVCTICDAGKYSTVEGARTTDVCLMCGEGTYAHRVSAPSDHLLALYSFDEVRFLDDSSGSGLSLSSSVPPPDPTSNCIFLSCANFSVVGLNWQCFYRQSLPTSGSDGFSVCLWYNVDETVLAGQTLFDFDNSRFVASREYDSENLVIRVHRGDKLVLIVTVASAFRSFQWNHFCAVKGANSYWSFYLNGSLQGAPYAGHDDLTTHNWTSNFIGRPGQNDTTDTGFMGRMGQFRIYNAGLTAEQALSLYQWRQESYNATVCSKCWVGTFSTALGATSSETCEECSAGWYSPAENASQCFACDIGKFSTSRGADSLDSCRKCFAGSYSGDSNASSCSACPLGTYSSAVGASANATCLTCDKGKTSAEGAPECRDCTQQELCFAWQCLGDQYRRGDTCQDCTTCKNASETIKQCSAYADAQCNPCDGYDCGTVTATMELTGFGSATDFEVYAGNQFCNSVAAALGGGITASHVFLTKVCFGKGCTILAARRRLFQSSGVTATFRVMSAVDPADLQSKMQDANFSSIVAMQLSKQIHRNITASVPSGFATECKVNFFSDPAAGCVACTTCADYLSKCSASSDAVCTPADKISQNVIIGVSAGGFVFVTGLALLLSLLFRTITRMVAQQRFVEAIVECKPGQDASPQHLPPALRDSYNAEKILGKGTFGCVILACTKKGDSHVAIKIVLSPQGCFAEQEMRQLNREARVLQILLTRKCEHAVALVGVEAVSMVPEMCWFVLEYIDGEDLEQVLRVRGPLSDIECIKVARSVLAALKVLHSEGIVHRDIKPANIMECSQSDSKGVAYKLIDFGTALGVDETLASKVMMTKADKKEMTKGTLPYMSPEMIKQSEKAEYPTDLWSLGVTLFQLATAFLPFQPENENNEHEWYQVIGGEEPAPNIHDKLGESRATFDRKFADVIAKALEKSVDSRYKTADEMHNGVYECLINKNEAFYSVFISYRVASEAPLARLLFDALNHTVTPGGHRVTVYWDAYRLVKGQKWEEGFASGLLNSLCFFPLLSYGSTAPLAALPEGQLQAKTAEGWEELPLDRRRLQGHESDWEDNVLKEFLIAGTLLERAEVADRGAEERGLLRVAYPLLIGRQHPPGHPGYPGMGDFFKVHKGGGAYPTRPSPPTNRAVVCFLRDNAGLPPEALAAAEQRSVDRAVGRLMSVQACRLWAHPKELEKEELTKEQREFIDKGYAGPPVDLDGPLTDDQRQHCRYRGLDEAQLSMLKAQIKCKIKDFHEVIDGAVSQHQSRPTPVRAFTQTDHPAPPPHGSNPTLEAGLPPQSSGQAGAGEAGGMGSGGGVLAQEPGETLYHPPIRTLAPAYSEPPPQQPVQPSMLPTEEPVRHWMPTQEPVRYSPQDHAVPVTPLSPSEGAGSSQYSEQDGWGSAWSGSWTESRRSSRLSLASIHAPPYPPPRPAASLAASLPSPMRHQLDPQGRAGWPRYHAGWVPAPPSPAITASAFDPSQARRRVPPMLASSGGGRAPSTGAEVRWGARVRGSGGPPPVPWPFAAAPNGTAGRGGESESWTPQSTPPASPRLDELPPPPSTRVTVTPSLGRARWPPQPQPPDPPYTTSAPPPAAPRYALPPHPSPSAAAGLRRLYAPGSRADGQPPLLDSEEEVTGTSLHLRAMPPRPPITVTLPGPVVTVGEARRRGTGGPAPLLDQRQSGPDICLNRWV